MEKGGKEGKRRMKWAKLWCFKTKEILDLFVV